MVISERFLQGRRTIFGKIGILTGEITVRDLKIEGPDSAKFLRSFQYLIGLWSHANESIAQNTR